MENKTEKPVFNPSWYDCFIGSGNEKEALVTKIQKLIGEGKNSCLEIGIGTKPIFAERIAKNFKKYVIVEKESPNHLKLGENSQLIKEDWESVSLNQKFDIIIASHVIYYFKNKEVALEKMFKHLNEGGKLFIVVNGKENDYGPTKTFFAGKIKKDYKFTYDQVLDLLKNKESTEYNLQTHVKFENLDNLHSSLKLIFDNYPLEYDSLKEDLINYWKEKIDTDKFTINQKIIEVINNKYTKDSLKVLKESQEEKGKYEIMVGGRRFIVHPNVFSPKYFSDTKKFCEFLPINKGDNVLEIGCGTGILSISAAMAGAEKVYATDINPQAVENTKENTKIHGLSDKIKSFVSDVYEFVPKDIKFDKIIWNGPFLHTDNENLSILEKSIFDKNYESLRKTIKESKNYLKDSGKLIIGFSTTIGRLDLLNKFLQEEGFDSKVIFKMQAPLGNPEGSSNEYDKINFELFEAKKVP